MSWQQPRPRRTRRVHIEGAANRVPPHGSRPPSVPTTAPGPSDEPPAALSSAPVIQAPPTSGDADTRQAERIIDKTRAEAADLSATVDRLARAIEAQKSEREQDFSRRAEETRVQSADFRASSLQDIESRLNADRVTALTTLRFAADVLAPGCAGAAWSQEWQVTPAATPPRHVRVGRLAATGVSPDVDLPALAPLMLSTGWFINAEPAPAAGLIQSAILRVAACTHLRHLQIRVFDPRVRGTLGAFSPLRAASSTSFPPALHTDGQLHETLDELTRFAATNAELIGSRHVADLGALWESEGVPTGQAVVLVVMDYPIGIDGATHEQLLRLAETGPARGISLIVARDPAARAAKGVKPKALERLLTPIDLHDRSWSMPGLPRDASATDDGPPPAAIVERVLAEAIRIASDSRGPVVKLADLLDGHAAEPWQESSDGEIEAIIGRRGRDRLAISLRSENPPTPNVLIGGAVGQGKSNLLLDIIYSMAVRYGPDQLEMLLLDFKQGLEFQRFDRDENGRNWLPHARVLCLESNKAFGLSVLQYVSDEMVRRSELFNRARANGYTAYREATGQPMRRLLLIVDEFQVLFDGHDDLTTESVRLFETIAKQGRAYGIHVLLSSQTVSGISGLQVKGDSIFAQFPIRISLKNTREESEAVLARQNTAAADLSYRGEVIVNRNLGMLGDGANERGIAAHAESGYLQELQAQLWQRAMDSGHVEQPWVFLGRSYAPWPGTGPGSADSTSSVGWIGRPLAITDQPVTVDFGDGADSGVALVGGGDDIAAAVLGALTVTTTAAWPSSRVVVLDGYSDTAADATAFIRGAEPLLVARGIVIDVIERADVTATLPRLRESSVPTLVIALGLHRVDLVSELSTDPDTYESITGADLLKGFTTGRANEHIIVVGWWPQLRSLTETLGYDHDGIGTYVLLRLGLDDLRSVAGPHALPPDGAPRVGVFSRNDDVGLREVIPLAALSAEITTGWAGVS